MRLLRFFRNTKLTQLNQRIARLEANLEVGKLEEFDNLQNAYMDLVVTIETECVHLKAITGSLTGGFQEFMERITNLEAELKNLKNERSTEKTSSQEAV